MSSGGRHVHRRRSHSASSPIRGPHLSDDPKWRWAAKRARPSYPRSPSYGDFPGYGEPPEKWDVDQWRRGKRARKNTTSRGAVGELFTPSSDSVCLEEPTSTLPPMSGLPCTSAAFDLFPERSRRKQRRASHHAHSRPNPVSCHDEELISSGELDQMRSHAFWELERSVAEGGEGLVRRMRDWENSRSRSSASPPHLRDRDPQRRSWRRSMPHGHENVCASAGTDAAAGPSAENDEDDVEIVSGDIASGSAYFHIRSPSHKRRALSMGTMDVDLPEIAVHPSPVTSAEGSEHCSSPIVTSAGVSAYSSDDEDLFPLEGPPRHSGALFTPALTHTYASSTNSSLVSLPLSRPLSQSNDPPPFTSAPFTFTMDPPPNNKSLHLPSSASRSEKAIAALTLAMANGAGGLNDYAALRRAEGASADTPSIDECQVGELWH